MVRSELISRSPLRILEKSINGGLGKGNIGVITARKGVGKTACLVHIATDQLFQEKHVIHVSFASDTSHIVAWYEDIFGEISERFNLDCAMDVHDDIIRHRVIMNFRQDGVRMTQVYRSIRSMIKDGNFTADLIVVDGYNFNKASIEDFAVFKELSRELGLEIWFSATVEKDDILEDNGIPSFLTKFLESIAIVICLVPKGEYIHLNLVKDHEIMHTSDMHLKLDPQILLIAEEI
jgi:hypothetical protein